MKNLIKEAYKSAGAREKVIMKSGTQKVICEDGYKFLVFSTANKEAIYDANVKMWIA